MRRTTVRCRKWLEYSLLRSVRYAMEIVKFLVGRAVKAVAGISKARDYVANFVQFFIQ